MGSLQVQQLSFLGAEGRSKVLLLWLPFCGADGSELLKVTVADSMMFSSAGP